MEIETERLKIREVLPGDADIMIAYASDPEFRRYLLPGQGTPREVRRWVSGSVRWAKAGKRLFYGLAVVFKETRHLIGGCTLTVSRDELRGYIGWELDRRYWGHGLGTEMARAMRDLAFTVARVPIVVADCYAGNVASIQIMEKIGMTRLTTNRLSSFLVALEYRLVRPAVRYGIRYDDWRQLTAPDLQS